MWARIWAISLSTAQDVEPGFTTREAGIVWVDLEASGIPRAGWTAVRDELADRAQAIPGIDVIGTTNGIPLTTGVWNLDYTIPGVDPPEGQEAHHGIFSSIDEHFFETMGITVVTGRGITELDRNGTEPVVVVSEAAARRFWPGQDPLGKEIIAVRSARSHRVVGVARDVRYLRLDETPQPLLYLSHAQHPVSAVRLVARGRPPPPEIAAALRRVVREVDADLVIMAETTLEEQMSVMLFPSRLAAWLLGVFGTIALVLAAVGLYGVVSFAVSKRTREMGIRISLGAEAGTVTWMMVRRAMGVVMAGAAVGLVAALGLSRLIGSFLIGVEPNDLVTLVSVPLLLCGVALVAAFVPARRAARISPVTALRSE